MSNTLRQYKNVLLVAPLNSQISEQAASLLQTYQSKLTIMSIAPELEEKSVLTKEGQEIDLQSLVEQEVKAELELAAAKIRNESVQVETVVGQGAHAFIEVIRQVESCGHDLVMMLADGAAGLREQLFGTLSLHLMRKCPCAVWVIKPSRRSKLRNVFAAIDPARGDAEQDDINAEILARASAVAQLHSAQLHVIHAWNTPFGSEMFGDRSWMEKLEVRLYAEKIAELHRERLEQFLQEHLDGNELVHLVQGSPGTVIPQTVAERNCDLLVMGTVCRSGIPGFFIGNTAETTLNQVDCSVLTVKPKGFVSPVVVS